MAYIKTFSIPAGFEGNYWRITKTEIDKLNNETTVEISLYKDKDARDAGATPFARKTFTLDLVSTEGDFIGNCYEAISNKVEDFQKFNKDAVAFFADATQG